MVIWDLDSIKLSLTNDAIYLTASEDISNEPNRIVGVQTKECYLLNIFDKLSQDRLCKKIGNSKLKFRKYLEHENLLARQSKLLNREYDI